MITILTVKLFDVNVIYWNGVKILYIICWTFLSIYFQLNLVRMKQK